MRKSFLAAGLALALFAVPSFVTQSVAQDQETEELEERESSWYGKPYALEGQDVISLWSDSGPVEGSKETTATWDNTEWRFSSEENRDVFLADPERYVPEFGGYCPVALSKNHLRVGSAKQYLVADDKLYVTYDDEAKDLFVEDTAGFIAGARANF